MKASCALLGERQIPILRTIRFARGLEQSILVIFLMLAGARFINASVAEAGLPRVFHESLVALDGEPSAGERSDLQGALTAFAASKSKGEPDWDVLPAFLSNHPKSPWSASLLLDLGDEYYDNGYFSRALDAWRQSWITGKSVTSVEGQAVANRAFAEWVRMLCRIGRLQDVKIALAQAQGRNFQGSTARIIETARHSLWMMENRPDLTYRCGPHALERIFRDTKPNEAIPMALVQSASGINGIPMTDVAALAGRIGLSCQMAKRAGHATIPLPAVVHWSLNHYAAVLKFEAGRYLIDDPTFGNGLLWVWPEALDSETDGYFLIPSGPLADGWTAVGRIEGSDVWGRGFPGGFPPPPPPPPHRDDPPDDGGPPDDLGPDIEVGSDPGVPPDPCGMAGWNVQLAMINLRVFDAPIFYTPPVGPPVSFNIHYNERASDQPAVFTFANLGPQWTCDWIASLTFDTANAYYHSGQGGLEQFTGFNPVTQAYPSSAMQGDTLVKLSSTNYVIQRRSGSKLVFGLPDNPVAPSRIFLTAIVDPQGNAATLTYDSTFRLTDIIDAIGQTTTLSYGNGASPLLITKVTDPFGRFATFSYNSTGELTNITDAAGLTSAFSYKSSDLKTLTTGYGTTSFDYGTNSLSDIFVQITEPDGEQQRFEEGNGTTPGIAFSDPPATVPVGILAFNSYLDGRCTYFWDRQAMAQSHGIYTGARIYHFMHQDLNTRSPIMESIKFPSQNRVWYNYQGQNSSGFYNYGMYGGAPSKVGVVLDNGETQLSQRSYNSLGRLTRETDPVGRAQYYSYATNNTDLVQVQRLVSPGQTEPVANFTWNSSHLPLTITDAARETTVFTYNSRGQPLTITNPKGQTTTFTYDASNYLTSVQGPLTGTPDAVAFTYDAFGRIHTVTDVGGYVLTYSYDALNRLTNVSYPDGTFVERTYNLLSPATFRDRRGRVTSYAYNALRQLVSVTDPLGRLTQYDWCGCGSLSAVVDPLGRMTKWTHDLLGRVTAKTYPNGSVETYAYDSAGLLKSVTDPSGQIKLFAHGLDNLVTSISYANAAAPTPTVEFVYDPWFPRLLERIDGAGVTAYAYNPLTGAQTPGAGQLLSIDGPLPNDTITYAYDELGRVTQRTIGGVAESVVYDAAGRVASASNALGNFAYTYDGATPRLLTTSLPNGQSAQFTYSPTSADRRLQEILNKLPGGATLSKLDYTYDADGFIKSTSEQRGANNPTQLTTASDLADRLTGATETNPAQTYGYTYDAADNRLDETVSNASVTATFNALNQVTSLSTNVESDRTYVWDAEGRLVAINYANLSQQTRFTYDGLNHCVRIVEESNGNITSDKHFIWCEERICEECDASGNATSIYFPQGVETVSAPNPGKYYYTFDRLGSIAQLTDSSGNIRADYQYDPWGRRTKLSGDLDADFGFTGYYSHAPSSLNLASLRAYDPALGRWLSRDPVSRKAGAANTYAYAENRPIDSVDPFGADTINVGIYTRPISGVTVPEGHASIDLGDGYTGFYPDPAVGAFGPNGPQTSTGVVRDPGTGENQSPEFVIPIYNVSPEQIQQMKDYIDQVRSDPCARRYNLLNRNCASFVREVLGAGGINIGGSQNPLGVAIHAGIQSGISSLSF